LYTTPVIYVFFDRLARRFAWRSGAVLNSPRTAEPL
jgi:hypothetical protein